MLQVLTLSQQCIIKVIFCTLKVRYIKTLHQFYDKAKNDKALLNKNLQSLAKVGAINFASLSV